MSYDVLKLRSTESAGAISGRQVHDSSADDIARSGPNKNRETADLATVDGRPQKAELPVFSHEPSGPGGNGFSSAQRSGVMERDLDALLLQLESLGLRLFVDERGQNGHYYPAGEFGRIDLLATDPSGNFVVINFKGDEPPYATIGQMAGYMAFVKKHLAKPKANSVGGWILARPSMSSDDSVLEEAAEAVGIQVKWYFLRLEFLETRGA